MSTPNVVLEPHTRGDTFVYSTTITGGWTAEQFTGGLYFTIRRRLPASTVVDDADAIARASVATGEIVAVGTSVVVTIAASISKLWLAKELVWDLQGVVAAVPENIVHTLSRGTIRIEGDVTRRTTATP
jgi:hypothetical protein